MQEKELANVAVTITQIIKTNLDLTPQEVVKNILDALPNTQIDDLIVMLSELGTSHGIKFIDIYDLIGKLQKLAKSAASDIAWNDLFQGIAQGLYFIGLVVKGFLPPKWRTVIEVVLDAYDEIKK